MTKAKSKGCCKDEHKYFSLKREHNQTKASVEIPNFFSEATVTIFINYNIVAINYPKAVATPIVRPPPLIHKQRLHILNCVYLI